MVGSSVVSSPSFECVSSGFGVSVPSGSLTVLASGFVPVSEISSTSDSSGAIPTTVAVFSIPPASTSA